MDRTAICDCQFTDTCRTYNDRLIPRGDKDRCGRGCRRQSDQYRNEHCREFRCTMLSVILADMLRSTRPRSAE